MTDAPGGPDRSPGPSAGSPDDGDQRLPSEEAADDPPPASILERLPRDDWDVIVRAARVALRDHVHPQAKRLHALPTGKLASGRSRRDLCALLASDGELWLQVAAVLARDERGEVVLGRVRDGDVPRPRAETVRDRDVHALEQRLSDAAVRLDRLRQRNRELLAERDEARRRADGLEGRLRTEQRRVEELQAEIDGIRRERDELAEGLENAAAERRSTVERVQRQHEAEVEPLREELRDLRRRQEERRRALERREASARDAEARAAEQITAYRRAAGTPDHTVRPGRPSRLPPGMDPAGSEAATALTTDGRLVLIDGYNVTKQHRGQAPLEQQRRWLVTCCESLAARSDARITVVFDGQEGVGRSPAGGRRVHVRFSMGRSADDELVDIVAGLPTDEPVTVVTDDRELRNRLARHRADTVATAAFLAVIE